MPKPSKFYSALPFEVEARLTQLGADLKMARLRRNMSAQTVADRLGLDRRVVWDMEAGKATVGVAAYLGLLWIYGLLGSADDVARPGIDEEGMTLERLHGRERAGPTRDGGMNRDF